MVDLHRHDEFSTFDGFGKATELAKLAKQLGHTSLSIANHGNTNGLVKHYKACKKEEIRCIMGVEAYFQPVIDKEKERYHLCLFAKNLKGYENINRLMYRGEQQKYYVPLITFEDLSEFSEGVICTSACISGFVSRAISAGKIKVAKKAVERFKEIFEDDFYIEIQPYKVDEEGTQEKINEKLMQIASECGVETILTSDSHYGKKEDFDTYLKMHEIAKHNYDIEATYGERYMPYKKELMNRMLSMHGKWLNDNGYKAKEYIVKMMESLSDIEDKVEQDILEELEQELPQLEEGHDSYEVLLKNVKDGLKQRMEQHPEKLVKKKEYMDRCKVELSVIKAHGISDYFLIVQDYVMWAKRKGIAVGPGRGSVCNCQVAWALGITDVDSLKFGLDFRRFLRMDKKKLPDIDLDFETKRRQEVIDYIVDKYKGHAAQICSFGLYKVDNLVNDLAKVCGMDDKDEIKSLKSFIARMGGVKEGAAAGDLEVVDYEEMVCTPEGKRFDRMYDHILKHFCKLYKKMRFVGTHAAGVAITSKNLLAYTSLRMVEDKETKEKRVFTVYDLADLDDVHVVKFDMLGLKTMESIGELRALTGNGPLDESYLDDEELMEQFRLGNTDGVFQFEKNTARSILKDIQTDCFEDVVAASSMNRPGPLSLKMPQTYAENKVNIDEARKSPFYKFTKETYGTIVYQEQLQIMCVEIGNMTWEQADRVMKLMKNSIASMGELDKIEKDKKDLTEIFVKGAVENGYDEEIARHTFERMLVYTFNKGHGVGYGIISVEEMYYKIKHPMEYWYTKLKYCNEDSLLFKFKEKAVASDALIFLPHVNYSADYTMRKFEGERVIQEGLRSIKGVGEKAAEFIERERKKNGPFVSYDDFYDRCKSRVVTSRVVEILKKEGALEFDKKTYLSRVTKYNSTLYMKGKQAM